MRRVPGWRLRLAAEMDRQRRLAFGWGGQDCALGLACGAVEAITGEDLGAGWRGRYTTPLGALRVLRKAGYADLPALLADKLPEIAPLMAREGDIALIEGDGPLGWALGVVARSGVIVMTEKGHGHLPRARVVRAFRVGEIEG